MIWDVEGFFSLSLFRKMEMVCWVGIDVVEGFRDVSQFPTFQRYAITTCYSSITYVAETLLNLCLSISRTELSMKRRLSGDKRDFNLYATMLHFSQY